MAKISAYSAETNPTLATYFPIVIGGVTKNLTLQEVADLISINVTDGSIVRADLASITRTVTMDSLGSSSGVANQLPDGSTQTASAVVLVPDDYVSGDITIKYLLRPVTTGTAVLRAYSYRLRSGSGISTVDSNVNVNQTFASTNIVLASRTFAAANFQAGDGIRFDLQRLGSDGSDTLAGVVDVDVMYIEYTGRA